MVALEHVLGSLPHAVFWKDKNHIYVGCNAAFARDVGLTDPADIVGKTDRDLPWSAEQIEFFHACDRKVIEHGETLLNLQPQARTVDGSTRILMSSKAPLRDAEGNTVGVIGVYSDVSEQKSDEAQLILADRLASVGTLAAGVAHEINNPLAVMLSNLEFVSAALADVELPSDDSKEVADALTEAKDAALRARKVVSDLRTFSQPDIEGKPKPTDVNAAVEAALSLVHNEVRHRARLDIKLGEIPRVIAHLRSVEQLVLNLIVNAIDAVAETENAKIRVETTHDENRVCIVVADNGPGISEDVRKRLFEPFVTSKPLGRGTGLGLFVTRNMVRSMGGEIELNSQSNQGTTFVIQLPAHGAPMPRRAHAQDDVVLAKAEKSWRVLIVDDDMPLVRSLERSLRVHHRVVAKGSVRDALATLDMDTKFDAILCDVMMPEFDGLDFYRMVSARHPDLVERIIFMTGGTFTREARAFVQGKTCLQKPFEINDLHRVMQAR